MHLLLWRHAEAEDGADDLARRLTSRGRKQAERVAAWLTAILPNEAKILVSPAVRAQQTARALGREMETRDEVAPGVDPDAVLQTAGWPDGPEWVLVVGHQPTLGLVAAELLGTPDCLSLRKGGLMWFESRKRNRETQVVLRAVIGPDLI
ncbi:MAG: phosphohistidine phosphatase SixA [Thiobacillaceae bacterium]